jgi:hypothetical protein
VERLATLSAALFGQSVRDINAVETDGGTRFPYGVVEIGYWFQDGDFVFLCDQDGVRTGDKRSVPKGVDAKTIAILLLKSMRRKAGGQGVSDRGNGNPPSGP